MALHDVLRAVADKIPQCRGASEADTRRALIDPVLNALGWDLADLSIARTEVRGVGGTVDYALGPAHRPHLLVEAKQLGGSLDKALQQVLGYVSAAPTRWIVATDGDVYRVYDDNVKGSHADKLVASTRISDGMGAAEVLELLMRDRVPLELENFVAYRAVRSAIEALFGEPPDRRLVNMLCRDGLDRGQVQAALRSVRLGWAAEPTRGPLPEPPSRGASCIPMPAAEPVVTPQRRDALSEGVYQNAVLNYLGGLPDGESTADDVYTHLRDTLELGPADMQEYPTGGSVWRKRAASALSRLKQRGQLTQPCGGRWRLAHGPASDVARDPSLRRGTRGPSSRRDPVRHGVTFADVLKAGLVPPGAELRADYKGQRVVATANGDGSVTLRVGPPETLASLSDAAGRARGFVSGDRETYSTNGWTFWSVVRPDGSVERLDRVRERYSGDSGG